MDFTVPADRLAAFREDARSWVDAHLPELATWAEEQRVTGNYHTPELHRRLAEAGWLGAGWPKEYGGTDNSVEMAQAIQQEIAAAGVHSDGWATTLIVINTLRHVGTEEQKHEFIGGALRGEVIIVLGYTEPDSGSDVAAAKTRATRDGDEWVIDGQKMFTSTAHLSTHAFVLTRTNPDAPKHKGLTTFLVRLDAPGVDIQPVWTLGGQRTNATFYTGVRTPDRWRVGEVDGGWRVMHVALVYERGGGEGRPSGPSLPERLARWAQQAVREDGTRVWDDPSVRERLARIAIDAEVSRMLGFRAGWAAQHDDLSGIGGAAAKLWGTERGQRHAWDMLDILGPEAVLKRESGDAPLDAAVEEAFRYGVVSTIYGGSSEIMREIVAERQLGLPRARPKV
ncbi:MAG TPA: acyl-CoA dehydrogenase family protein [Acidimicrobiales bacterium]|nr:acyl-CoA dehydrogenase family protein [Acidimicrobiales bacterium]